MKKEDFKNLSPLEQYTYLAGKTIQWVFTLIVSGLVVLTLINWIF